MKKLLLLPILALVMGCSHDDYTDIWEEYNQWRLDNDQWIIEQEVMRDSNGDVYYKRVVPSWNINAYVLMHFFNDTEETAGNLVPLYTSTVAVKYEGQLYNGTVFDSSYSQPDSIFTTTPGDVIPGWTIALQNMHVGDSCEVVIPYQYAYNTSSQGIIKPFSCLKFKMKLVDIPYYELKP